MSEPWGDPSNIRTEIEQATREVTRKMATETVSCSAGNENIVVVMGLDQTLKEVTIERGAARMYGAERLGHLLVEALQAAHDKSHQRINEVVGEVSLFGVPMTDMMTVVKDDPRNVGTLFER
jgi:DNA-binding protein YbaB